MEKSCGSDRLYLAADDGHSGGELWSYAPDTNTGTDDDPALPTHRLTPVYPLPVATEARFTLRLARSQNVCVALFDVLGRQVALLYEGPLSVGVDHPFMLRASGLPSGLYLLRAAGEDFSETRRVPVVR